MPRNKSEKDNLDGVPYPVLKLAFGKYWPMMQTIIHGRQIQHELGMDPDDLSHLDQPFPTNKETKER